MITLNRKIREITLRPGIFGGLIGGLNLAVLAGIGWFAYDRWNDPGAWTRRNLTTAGLGVVGWFGGQGCVLAVCQITEGVRSSTLMDRLIVEQYATKEYPRRKERK